MNYISVFIRKDLRKGKKEKGKRAKGLAHFAFLPSCHFALT